jgi:hypothetical protein
VIICNVNVSFDNAPERYANMSAGIRQFAKYGTRCNDWTT